MKRSDGYGTRSIVVMLLALLELCAGHLWARPTTPQEAQRLVVGWLRADPEPLGAALGGQVRDVETFTNELGEAIYHIVYLEPSGFVIVSADDLVEPIIGFVQGDRFDPSPDNPLGALVADDLSVRVAAVRTGGGLRITAEKPFGSPAQAKWRRFLDLADAREGKGGFALMSVGVESISEVRVAPLVKSKWGQYTVSALYEGFTVGEACGLPCYNYYTPNNYLCGCPATALAQLMRYHEYPTDGIGVTEFTITLGFPTGPAQQASTRGGDGLGGPYKWDQMTYVPNCDTPEVEREAIGALCYDAGVSMNQMYSRNASGWPGCTNVRMTNALTTTFMYANVVHGYSGESSPIGIGLPAMINPNLDAHKPVILGTVQHAFVCDGYGYNDSTLYHHLNMGWLGLDDLWYDLRTNIVSPVDGHNTGTVCSCVYNVQTVPAGDGEIISGQVLDHNGEPIVGVVLHLRAEGEIINETVTGAQGIYAFDYLRSNTAYGLHAALKGYGFNSQEVTTGISQDDSVVCGNVWGVDFVGLPCDFNSDQRVDVEDLTMLIEHWGQDELDFDVAPAFSGDGIVDILDLQVLLQYWGMEVEVPDFGLAARWRLDEADGDTAAEAIGENSGILNGEPTWQPDGGILAGALQFDGVDDCVSTPFVVNPEGGPFSALAWIKGGAPGQVIISQANGANWLMIDLASGTLGTELVPPKQRVAVPPLVSDAVVTDSAWHRVAFVWDGMSRSLHVDGTLAAMDERSSLAGSNGGLYLGCGADQSPESFFSGLIDDVRIYNRAVRP